MFENLFRFRFIYDWVSEHWNITQDISIRGAGNGVKDTDWEWLLVGRQSRCEEWAGRSEGRTLCWCLNISVFYVWAFNWILNRPDRVWQRVRRCRIQLLSQINYPHLTRSQYDREVLSHQPSTMLKLVLINHQQHLIMKSWLKYFHPTKLSPTISMWFKQDLLLPFGLN